MKKLSLFLTPFIAVSGLILFGCKNKDEIDNRIVLSFGDVHASEVTTIKYENLADHITNQDNFLFVVSSNTCTCWQAFKPVIEKYITENKLICYQIPFNEFEDYQSNFNFIVSSSSTTFVIFENGESKYVLNSSKDSGTMEDYGKFKSFMDDTIRMPGCYHVKEEDIDNIKISSKSAVIYYERSKCGDCTYINPRVIRDYVKNHKGMNKIYVLDCQPWKELEAQDYQAKKDKYGLSNVNNPDFGFDSGVFPYFSLIENGKYTSGAVAFNDELNSEDPTNVFVKNSYYTQERVAKLGYSAPIIKDKKLTDNDLSENKKSWKHESAEKTYNPIINAFLDYALPKVNYEL